MQLKELGIQEVKYTMDNEELSEAIKAAHVMVIETCGKGEHYEKVKHLLFELIDIQIVRAGLVEVP